MRRATIMKIAPLAVMALAIALGVAASPGPGGGIYLMGVPITGPILA